MEKLITRKEAAKLLGISLATLDEARNISLLPTFKNMLPNAPIGQNLWKRKRPTEMCVMVKHSICEEPKDLSCRGGSTNRYL